MNSTVLIKGEQFPMQLLNEHDVRAIIQLQDRVAEALQTKEHLQKLTVQEIEEIIVQRLFAGVFAGEMLIAARAFLLPELDDQHLAKDVGITEEEWSSVIYSEISLVDPQFQGNGLQKQMGIWWMEHLQNSRYRYVCATVAPFNIASLKDKFQLGMTIGALKEKYTGKLRYVFVKDLHTNQHYGEKIVVAMDDRDRQQQLLQSGYRGIAINLTDTGWTVDYSHYSIS
ncbi:hypothetical protein MKY84_02585 [Chryseomicrobium sp. FSL W7-1435]|uniref:hypothetical protein n=1 Tax=Chryseomicrobium sp. FSL W7-1435 TaxID=2921704 RepID=UPI00315995D1